MDYENTKAYKQQYQLKQILEYIYFFKRNLMEELVKCYSLTNVDAPLIEQYRKDTSLSFFSSQTRELAFSSHSTNIYLQIPIYFDLVRKEMLNKYVDEGIKGIIYDTPIIWRDTVLDNFTSLKWNQIELEFVLDSKKPRNVDEMKNIISLFNNAFFTTLEKLKEQMHIGKEIEDIPFVSATSLVEKFGNLNQKKIVEQQARENEIFYLIDNVRNGTLNSESYFHFHPTTHRKETHTKLLVFFEKFGLVKTLMEAAYSLNHQELLSQLDMYHFPTNTTKTKKMSEVNLISTFAMKIYVPRIIMYLLQLAHIAEVVKSEWPKELLTFIQKHGIKIL